MISRSFTAISPYLRPAPGSTWAPRARWYLIDVKPRKEPLVVKALEDKKLQTFFPTELRVYAKTRGKTRHPEPHALISGKMFVRAELADFCLKAVGTQYLTGFERDDEGFPMPTEIPDDQMQVFIDTHQEYLAEAQKRLALSKALGRGAKAKQKYMPAQDALQAIKEQMESKG